MKPFFLTIALSFFSFNAHALIHCARNSTTIDVRVHPYQSLNVVRNQRVTVDDEEAVRVSVMTAVVGTYRLNNGLTTLRVGTPLRIIYKDGSRECGVVTNTSGSAQAEPIPDTARRPGDTITWEDTLIYIDKYRFLGSEGGRVMFNVCYDYYTNGVWTDTECHIERF